MKIYNISTVGQQRYVYINKMKSQNEVLKDNNAPEELRQYSGFVCYPQITFTSQCTDMLLKGADSFKCAYTGKRLLSKASLDEINKVLDKKTNSKSAVEYLQTLHDKNYISGIESSVLNFLKFEADEDVNFKEIFQSHKLKSQKKLKEQRNRELAESKKIIKNLSRYVRYEVLNVYEEAKASIKNRTLDKRELLQKLDKIVYTDADEMYIEQIRDAWSKLSDESNNIDAYIIENSKLSHRKIARKLISSSLAEIEVIGNEKTLGREKLTDCILISSKAKQEKENLSDEIYYRQNISKIRQNFQTYLNILINEVKGNKKSILYKNEKYPSIIGDLLNMKLSQYGKTSSLYYPKPVSKNNVVPVEKKVKTNRKNGNSITQGMNFLLGISDKLSCAYTRKRLISPKKADGIYSTLDKKTNAEAAIKYLEQFQRNNYMYDLESQILDILRVNSDETNDFRDILQSLKPESAKKLKQSQLKVIAQTSSPIEKLSEDSRSKFSTLCTNAIEHIEDGNFHRERLFKNIERIETSGNDTEVKNQILKILDNLPSEKNNVDAFICDNAWLSHSEIAKRLISPSVATVKFILPLNKGGQDKLSNYILVSSKCADEMKSLTLSNYVKNSDENIFDNVQKYINDLITLVGDKGSAIYHKTWFPMAVAELLRKESSELKNIEVDVLRLEKILKPKMHNNIRNTNRKNRSFV